MTHHRPRTQSAKLRIEFSFQLQMLCGSGQSRELLHGVGVYRGRRTLIFHLIDVPE
jgi:hypothetical protein